MQDRHWEKTGVLFGGTLVDQKKADPRRQQIHHPASNQGQEVPINSHTQTQEFLSSPIVKVALTIGALYIGGKALSELLQSDSHLNEVEKQILASR